MHTETGIMRTFVCLLSTVLIIGSTVNTTAQVVSDMVRYSRPMDYGSARYTALGGAFSALGNDFSAVDMNPAGLAIYRMNEMSFGAFFRFSEANTTHYNNDGFSSESGFRINQFGFVSTNKLSDDLKFNWGLHLNRSNDYGFRHYVEGNNTDGSIVDQWVASAQFFAPGGPATMPPEMVYEELANNVGLISYNSGTSNWEQHAWGSSVRQIQDFHATGGKTDLALSLAWQKDKVWNFGGSVVVPIVRYHTREVYEESNYDPASAFSTMTWENLYNLEAAGLQAKLGILWTPEPWARVSAYYHSPMWLSIRQNGTSYMLSEQRNGTRTDDETQLESYNWNLFTASRFGVGYATVLDKNGLISLDYSFQNLSSSTARASAGNELDYLNEAVQNELRGWHDVRVGAEWRIQDWFVRAGYHFTSTGFSEAGDLARQYSGGFGYKANKWGIDITYTRRMREDSFYLYSPQFTQTTDRRLSDNLIMTSVYFRL